MDCSLDAIVPYRERAPTVVAALGSDARQGLSSAEAQQRLDEYGVNRLKSSPVWRRLSPRTALHFPLRGSGSLCLMQFAKQAFQPLARLMVT
jgi:Cation transporter/ATPase, N-terminus